MKTKLHKSKVKEQSAKLKAIAVALKPPLDVWRKISLDEYFVVASMLTVAEWIELHRLLNLHGA